MPAPATAATFLDLLGKSGLHPPADLDRYLSAIPGAAELPPDELAGRMIRDGLLTPFQATHLLRGRYKNFFIGKFKVLRPLGTGGMSQVFLCEHTTLKHRVALKLLPVKDSKDPAAVGRFQREARAAASVNHPNVVRAHDFDQSADGKFYYLVMDYVDGVNLHELVQRVGPLPPLQAANFVAQAAVGMQHIHECGLIHRDIKPGNLLLDRAGQVRILDLGLVRYAADDGDNLTRRVGGHTVLGTADFLAPEQAMNSDDLDIRADIYSLGATFYYLLAGAAPFQDLAITQKLMAHQLRDPAPVPGLPVELAAVLYTMLRKEPKDRYQTPADAANALLGLADVAHFTPDPSWFPDTGDSPTGPRTNPPSTRSTLITPPVSRTTLPVPVLMPPPSTITTAATPKPEGQPAPASRRPVGLLIGGVVAVVAALAAVAVVWNPFGRENSITVVKQNGGPVPTAPDKPKAALPAGAVGVGPGQAYRTVAEALAAVPPGGRVLITSAEHAEELSITGGPGNVSVQGWPDGQPVVWRRPDGAAGKPLVAVADVPGFSLVNVRLDGKGQTDVLVSVSGRCPGLVLDGVSAVGFRTAAVRLSALAAEPSRPTVVRRLRATGPGEAGVQVAEGRCRNLLLDRCRFDGPLKAGVRCEPPTERVTVRNVRFDGVAVGVSLVGDTKQHGVALLGNTFAGCETGLLVGAVTGPAPGIEVKDNLFFRTASTARSASAEGKPTAPDAADWVWHEDGLAKDKQTNVPPGVRHFRKAFDLAAAPTDAVLDVGCATTFEVWVNGTRVGASGVPYFNKRVYAYPVGQLLKAGRNVIAVQGSHTRDPVNSGFATAAGLTVRLTDAAGAVLSASDASWKSAEKPAVDWQATGFDDAAWKPVKVWGPGAYVLPWQGAVWDSVVKKELGLPTPLPFAAAGNVRDYTSQDGFPLLNCVRGYVPALAGTDPADDATYLRTPRSIEKLYTLGHDGGPVGVPLDR